MAQVKLKQGIESLSGTIGNVTFRTYKTGKVVMLQKPEPQLPPNATRKQKAAYKKHLIVHECVTLIQSQMNDMLLAIKQRNTIYTRIARLYDKHAPSIKARTKLQRAIMTDYYALPQ